MYVFLALFHYVCRSFFLYLSLHLFRYVFRYLCVISFASSFFMYVFS